MSRAPDMGVESPGSGPAVCPSVEDMRTPVSFLAVVPVTVLLLGGCTPADPPVTPRPVPSSTPAFASDEEALAAATKAYGEYQEALDRAFSTYETGSLNDVATDSALKSDLKSVADYRAAGKHQEGSTSVDTVSPVDLGALTDSRSGDGSIQIYACLDVSKTDVLDASGVSVVQPGSDRRFPMLVSMNWREAEHQLLVSNEEDWTGANFC